MAYHWTSAEGTLGYEDGRQVVVGEVLAVADKDRAIKCCEYGMHSSTKLVDALKYAPGCRLWEVSHPSGITDSQHDKQVGRDRKAEFDYGDCRDLVVKFAQWCAKRAAGYGAVYAVIYGARAADRATAGYGARAAAYAGAAATAAAAAAAATVADGARAKERKAQKAWWDRQLRKRKQELTSGHRLNA